MKRLFLSGFVLLALFSSAAYTYNHEGKLKMQYIIDGQMAAVCYVSVDPRAGVWWCWDDYDIAFSEDYLMIHSSFAYSIMNCDDLYQDKLLSESKPAMCIKRIYNYKLQFGFWGHIVERSDEYFAFMAFQNADGSCPFAGHYVYLSIKNGNPFRRPKRYCLNPFLGKTTFTQITIGEVEPDYYDEPTILKTAYITITPYPRPCHNYDFDMDGYITFGDFAAIAKDFKKPFGFYESDIAGPNDLPDGYVDIYDIKELAGYWQTNIYDLNGDGYVNLIDYAVIAKQWGKAQIPDYSGEDGIEDGIVDYWDLALFTKK